MLIDPVKNDQRIDSRLRPYDERCGKRRDAVGRVAAGWWRGVRDARGDDDFEMKC